MNIQIRHKKITINIILNNKKKGREFSIVEYVNIPIPKPLSERLRLPKRNRIYNLPHQKSPPRSRTRRNRTQTKTSEIHRTIEKKTKDPQKASPLKVAIRFKIRHTTEIITPYRDTLERDQKNRMFASRHSLSDLTSQLTAAERIRRLTAFFKAALGLLWGGPLSTSS